MVVGSGHVGGTGAVVVGQGQGMRIDGVIVMMVVVVVDIVVVVVVVVQINDYPVRAG